MFRRASYDEPWVLDQAATIAGTPPPQRAPFPERVQGTLTTVRIEPAGAAAALLEESRRLEAAMAATGAHMLSRVEFELVGAEATDVSVVTQSYKNRWRACSGWVDDRGRPVVFWSDHPLGATRATRSTGASHGERPGWCIASSVTGKMSST